MRGVVRRAMGAELEAVAKVTEIAVTTVENQWLMFVNDLTADEKARFKEINKGITKMTTELWKLSHELRAG